MGIQWNLRRLILCSALLFITGCASMKEVRLGDQFAEQGNWEGAVVAYQAALSKDPTDLSIREKLDEVKSRAAELHLLQGKELLNQQNIELAVQEFKRALSLDPSKKEHQSALADALRKRDAEDHYEIGLRLANVSKFKDAIREFEETLRLDPSHVPAQVALVKVVEEVKALETEEELALKSTQPITLKFQNARLKEVFELLSKTSGINILFDKDVRDDNVTIFVRDVSFKEALNLILATNNLFMKKINEETILIIPKIKQKVDQYQDLLIRTFYLSNVTAKDMVNLLRTMLETRRVFVNNELNAIVLRDTPEKMKLAEKIINANDRKVAEVTFDVEILEVDKTKGAKYGWNFTPNQGAFSLAPPGSTRAESGLTEVTLNQLNNLGQAAYLFSIPSVIVDFLKTQSNAKTLANPKIRILNNEDAKINIGDKVPILLSSTSFSTGATGEVVTGGATNVTTNIEFKDVGITLNVKKPNIHLNNDVTVTLKLDITTLGEKVDLGQGQEQFKFGNRSIESVLNIKDGETVVIGGLIREDQRKSVNKVPGLGDIPVLGYLFSGFDTETVNTDLLLTITPHVVRGLETPNEDIQSFWSGTGEAYSTKPLFSDFAPFGGLKGEGGLPPLPKTSSPPSPRGSERPSSGTPPSPGGAFPPSVFPPSPGLPPSSLDTPRSNSGAPSPTNFFPRNKTGAFQGSNQGDISVVQFHPQGAELTIEQQMSMSVRVDQISKVSEAHLTLSYDPKVLTLEKAQEGSFLKQGGANTSFAASENGPGRVKIHVKRFGDSQGISGSGDLVQLTFSGKGVGTSPILLENPQLLTPAKGYLPIQSTQGQIRVQ